MKSRRSIIEAKNGHKHNWVFNGKTIGGKQRYKCTECNKTCVEFSKDRAKLYYEHNLRLIHSHVDSDDNFIWDEVINYDENNEMEDAYEIPFYKIDKRTVTWKQFQRIIRGNKYSPLVVYTVKGSEDNYTSNLCMFEVVFND